jgi:hypothetical protein
MARMTAARLTAATPTLMPTMAPIERFDADAEDAASAEEEALLLLLADVADDAELVIRVLGEVDVGAASVTVGSGDC